VKRKVWDEVCDPCTGKVTRCPRYVYDEVEVSKKRKVFDDVPYTFTKAVKEKVPVTKKRKVCKFVEVPGVQKVKRMVPVESTKMVTQYQQETVMTTKVVRKCVVEYVEQPKCIKKRVQVPCETAAAPTCTDGCRI